MPLRNYAFTNNRLRQIIFNLFSAPGSRIFFLVFESIEYASGFLSVWVNLASSVHSLVPLRQPKQKTLIFDSIFSLVSQLREMSF